MKKSYGKYVDRWERFGKGCLIFILAGLALLAGLIWLFFYPLPKVCRDPAKYEKTLADSKLRTGFVAFPPSIPDSGLENGAVFYYFYQDTFLDPTGEVFLRCTYSEEDYQAEIDRLEHYAQQPPTNINKKIEVLQDEPNRFLRDEKGRFSYPAYIAVFADDYACEYALLTGEREISYVYFAFREPGRFRKVPADCLPEPFDAVKTRSHGRYNIYSFKKPGDTSYISYDRNIGETPVPEPTPEPSGERIILCAITTPDGVERLISGERAGELYHLLAKVCQEALEERLPDDSASDLIYLLFSGIPDDSERNSNHQLQPYYMLYADESCVYGLSTYMSNATELRLPEGSYQNVLELVSDCPTRDEALAACVRARPSGGDGTYSYDLFDLEGNYVQDLGPYGEPISLRFQDFFLSDPLIALCGSGGPERLAAWRVYYDPADGTLSEAYYNVLFEDGLSVLCGGLDRVTAREPMSGEIMGEITDFSEPLAPTADSPFLGVEEEEGVFVVSYLAGEDFHTAADRFHRAMGEDSPILYIHCEDTAVPEDAAVKNK